MDTEIHPAPAEFSNQQMTEDPILHFFHYSHLPPQLRSTSRQFFLLAAHVVNTLPRNAERTVALRKLLEAKDAAVRANLPAPGFTKPSCRHERIYAPHDVASNGPAENGRCTACDQLVPSRGYAQSAMAAEGFLVRLPQPQPIGEPVETGGHDEDRDGPVPFEG